MTPRQFQLLGERFQEARKREDRRAGGIIAMLYNIHRDPEKDSNGLEWWDFFLEWKEDTEQTEEAMLEVMRIWAASTKALPS